MLLSSRTIHFNRAEIAWECRKCIRCECGLDFIGSSGSPKLQMWETYRLEPDDLKRWRKWRSIVKLYSLRYLSYDSDTLPALSGLAKRWLTGEAGQQQYLAGLWRASILNDLLWYKPRRSKRPINYQAPTWSWASCLIGHGILTWATPRPASEGDIQYSEFVDAGCELKSVDITAVESGYLVLRGVSISGVVSYREFETYRKFETYGDSLKFCFFSDGTVTYPCYFDIPIWEEGPNYLSSGSQVDILLMQWCQYGLRDFAGDNPQLTWTSLLLASVPGSEAGTCVLECCE